MSRRLCLASPAPLSTTRPRLANSGAKSSPAVRLPVRPVGEGRTRFQHALPLPIQRVRRIGNILSNAQHAPDDLGLLRRRQPASSPSTVTVQKPSRLFTHVQASADRHSTYSSQVSPSPHVWMQPCLPLMHHTL